MLGNDDGVNISLGSALPVGNCYKSFQCMVHDIRKNVFILYFLFLIKTGKGLIHCEHIIIGPINRIPQQLSYEV